MGSQRTQLCLNCLHIRNYDRFRVQLPRKPQREIPNILDRDVIYQEHFTELYKFSAVLDKRDKG